MTDKPRIVVFSHYFSPSSMVGGKRFSYLCREFERHGFDVHVIAAELLPADVPDQSLPRIENVHRCHPILTMPDYGPGFGRRIARKLSDKIVRPLRLDWSWIPPALKLATGLLSSDRGGVIVATSPPFSTVIAGALAARRCGWPLVVDYRDPWSAYPWYYRGRLDQWIAHAIEKWCLNYSSACVFNTSEMRAWFEQYFPDSLRKQNVVIPNGFDEPLAHCGSTELTRDIVHAGAIYGDRSIVPVLLALNELIKVDRNYEDVRIVVYGEVPGEEMRRMEKTGLLNLVKLSSRVSKVVLSQKLSSAGILLAVSGQQMSYSIPYKVYDYISVQRPALVLSPIDSAVCKFVNESGAGIAVSPDDIPGISLAIRRLMTQPEFAMNTEVRESYRWSSLATDFLTVIERVRDERIVRRVRAAALDSE